MLLAARCRKCTRADPNKLQGNINNLQWNLCAFYRFPTLYSLSPANKRYISTSTKTHYEVLGVKRDATSVEIKDAFLLKSKQTHPDVNPGDPSKEREFVLVNEAYTVLRNPSTRKEYDRSIGRPPQHGYAHGTHARQRHAYPRGASHRHTSHKQTFTWGEGPFSQYPKDERGRYGFYNSKTGRFDFDTPLGEEMRRWEEDGKRYNSAREAEREAMNRLSKKLVAIGLVFYAVSVIFVYMIKAANYRQYRFQDQQIDHQTLLRDRELKRREQIKNKQSHQPQQDSWQAEFGRPVYSEETSDR